ncbi:MAG: xanthine dehydrogenase family protein subunit M [Chitinophagaceae bacterium]|nr:xanthine dehydrogenase family protein subunit M [Chitinophagaceae bacterium]
MINFEYMRVNTVKAAVDALRKYPDSAVIAGGTNLVDLMKKGVTSPGRLIDITNLPLKEIIDEGNGLHIGALVANSDLADDASVQAAYPLLSQALKAGASAQLRNMATVGGNLLQRTRCGYFYDTAMPCNKRKPGSGCGALQGYNRMHAIFGSSSSCIAVHPSDMCVALAALDAQVLVSGPAGDRKITFTDFHRLPGTTPEKDNNLNKNELITGVYIPSNQFGHRVHYLKVRDRASYAFALVSVAAALNIRDGRIVTARLAMGGVAHKPWRLFEAEKTLSGKAPAIPVFEQAAQIAMKDAKASGSNNFKLKLAPASIVEALTKASGISGS